MHNSEDTQVVVSKRRNSVFKLQHCASTKCSHDSEIIEKTDFDKNAQLLHRYALNKALLLIIE